MSQKIAKSKSVSKPVNKTASKANIAIKSKDNIGTVELENKPVLQQNQIQCENCGNAACTYCQTCDIMLCAKCFDSIHTNPALQYHQKTPENILSLFTKQCGYHVGKRCRHVCTGCNVFICDLCKQQMHFGLNHTTQTIHDAFQSKINSLQQLLNVNTSSKQQQLQNNLFKFEQVEKQLQQNQDQILFKLNKEVDVLTNQVNQQKNNKYILFMGDKEKLKSLVEEVDQIQKTLIQVQTTPFATIVQRFQQIADASTQRNPVYLQHIGGQKKEEANIFTLLTQIENRIKSMDNIDPNGYLQSLENFDTTLDDVSLQNTVQQTSSNAIALKESLIQQLTVKLQQQQEQYTQELSKWMKLTENYAQVVVDHQLQCCFCNAKLYKNAANQLCSANTCCEKNSYEAVRRAEKIVEKDGDVSVEKAVECVGNGLHYWVSTV